MAYTTNNVTATYTDAILNKIITLWEHYKHIYFLFTTQCATTTTNLAVPNGYGLVLMVKNNYNHDSHKFHDYARRNLKTYTLNQIFIEKHFFRNHIQFKTNLTAYYRETCNTIFLYCNFLS